MSIAEAFAAAEQETGVAAPVVEEVAPQAVESELTPSDEQAAEVEVEQPDDVEASVDEVDDDLQALLDSEDSAEGESDDSEEDDQSVTPERVIEDFVGSDEFWNVQVPSDGDDGPITVREMYEGMLRQSDYTKKTQDLAAQRETLKQADEFYQAFLDDTAGFAAAIAVKAGYITEDEATRTVDIATWRSAEEVEAEVERRVAERIQDNPDVKSAQAAQQRAAVESAFATIESERGVRLSESRRASILSEAMETGTTNLALVFDAQVGRARAKADRAARAKKSAPSKASTSSPLSADEKPTKFRTVAEAMDAARLQIAAS